MNREEYHLKIGQLTEEAIDSKVLFLDIIAVLESTKIATQIMLHESARHAKVI